MHVLALGPESYGGFAGIAQGTRDFLDGLATSERVESVHLLARRRPDGGPATPESLTSEACPGSPLRYARRAYELARTGSWDLVFCLHVNLMPVAAALAWRLHVPLWLTIHGIDAWEAPRSLWRRRAIARADVVTSSSRTTRERFLGWSGVAPERVHVNNNPVHAERLGPGPKPASLVERYGLHGRRVLLTLGRMLGNGRTKGHDEILAALPRVLERVPNLTWLVVGEGPDAARIQQAVQASGLEDHVVFAGRIPEEEKHAHYLVADAFALTSTTEGFGIVFLEAAACGLPVLGSSRDGSRDALADGELGRLVDPFDEDALVDGLLDRLQAPRHVPEALERFHFDEMAARMRGLLDRAVPPIPAGVRGAA